ncbi:MAG: cytochrome c oxidase cbb3-type subunit 3 [Halieaceae bacterium]|jgi:cytochrome c oxidase cbb3-type subunit 3
MTSFWSAWVTILTSVTIIVISWILIANKQSDRCTGERTTGHVYDGIEEYDNPLPTWWFYMFVITTVWGIAYLIVYPGMGNYPGLMGWTQIDQYDRSVAAADEKYRAMRDRYLALPFEEIALDPALRKMGARMFSNNCAQCHGSDAKGSYGFPNLADNDWIYGGDAKTIKQTLIGGRQAAMPAWGNILGDQGVSETTAYTLSLNGRQADPELVAAGESKFVTYCAACHGADAGGNTAMGAPNLSDGVWLYGGTEAQIAHSIRAGRNGVMPAFKSTLGEDKIHILTAYVYGLKR